MKSLLMFFILVSSTVAWGDDIRVLTPTKVTMEYYSVKNNRDLYLGINDPGSNKFGESQEYWKYGAAVDMNYDILRYTDYAAYMENHVHMAASNVAVRHVGWEYELGLHLGASIDLFWYHHSQHLMDEERQAARFPLENYYGCRLVLIEKGRK